MNTIELFSGTKSFSKVMQKYGHKTITIDNNVDLDPDINLDILNINFDDLDFYFYNKDILWASPPCTAFSVASIGKNWTGGKNQYIPKTEKAKLGISLVKKTISLIQQTKPKYWFIENPRGVLRKLIDKMFEEQGVTNYRRVTLTYCQYGDTRMKPTDIWTNDLNWKPRPMCKNGDKCHISAPRGSKTGTQGLKNATERGVIPPLLFEEILEHINRKELKNE
jgi:hypothetical protein